MNFDELSPEDQVKARRDRAREDAERAHHQAIYDARVRLNRRIEDIQANFAECMRGIDRVYKVEMAAISAPKIIEVAHGMVLFG